jgi:hypothetical protein
LTQFKATIQDPDQEANRLADRLEEHIKEKQKQDFQILLLKCELDKRYPYRIFLQKPPDFSPNPKPQPKPKNPKLQTPNPKL